MENIVLKDEENLKSEKHKLSTINGIESKRRKLLIRGISDCSKNGDLEIEKCNEIVTSEEKYEDNSNADDIFIEVIETNELENQIKQFPEFIIYDSSSDSESFQTLPNCVNNISIQPTQHISKTRKQIDHILETTHFSPERKKIKLFSEELSFDSKLETSIQTSENVSKNKLISLNGINLIPNKSLNEKTQNNYNFSDSVINVNAETNVSNDYNFNFSLHENNKTLIENNYNIKNNELKPKSLFKNKGKTFINSEGENESRRESCETNYSGDTLILNYEGSDIDSEIERCNELLNQNSENVICSKINSNDSFQNYNNLNSNNNSEKDNVKIQEASLNNTNETLSLKVNIQCGTDIVDSTQLSNDESDIESEMEKCNQLLNMSDNNQIIASDDNSQFSDNLFYLESSENSQTSCDNLFYLENDNNETEDIKYISENNKYKGNSKLENIVITLKNNYCQKESEKNTDPENIVSLNKISENETRENSEIQNITTLNKIFKNETQENSEFQNIVTLNQISENEKQVNSEFQNIVTLNKICKIEKQENPEIKNIVTLNEISEKEKQENSAIQNIETLNKISENEKQEHSQIQNIVTLNKISENEKRENSEIQNIVTLNKISENEKQGNPEIQNIVNLDNKSPKEIEIDKKILFTNITPQKHRPERIFKLAIKSLNEISVDNSNSASKIPSNSSDKNNNSFPASKINDKEVSKEETVKDYFEDEKDDITNPEWQAVKNLSTNEERYQQVRKCWKSRTVPDPNKNLTYHSYRKRLFSGQTRSIKQHKRHASSSLPGRDAKRPCTFFLDREIDSIKRTKDIQKQEIINEMHSKIDSVGVGHFSRESSLNMFYTQGNDFYRQSHHPLDRNNRVTIITDEYQRIVSSCENSFRNKISALNERRNEVLKFYSFYQGLNDSYEDPTLLTDSQFQELDEIENIYEQFNHYYGEKNN